MRPAQRRPHQLLLAVVAGVLALAIVPLAPAASPARAAGWAPKVVVIVGPVGSLTADYISWGREAAAEARKHTPNVVELYSPKATWDRVRPALQGASVVIYLGHGNGWPSRYRTTPWPQSQNGLGLNPTAGTDNTTTQYWGEYYLARDVRLAPNAVVLMHRLCYASGNSEPGLPEAGLAVAQQRADNFAAGWLAAGARVAIAEGHYAPLSYVQALFSRSVTLDRVFADAPGRHGHTTSSGSVRTPGAVVRLDPDTTTSGFYRSIAGWPAATTTDQVVRAAYASTATTPTALTVPGAAATTADPTGLYADPLLAPADAGGPPATLPVGTIVRLTAAAAPLPDATAVYAVTTLDGKASGFVRGADLAPRDSSPPAEWWTRTGTGSLSPNGDGWGDTLGITGRLSEPAAWQLRVRNAAGTTVGTFAGTGSDVVVTWTGLGAGGSGLPAGTYTYEINAIDGAGNVAQATSGPIAIDYTAPAAAAPVPAPAAASMAAAPPPLLVTPNGDGVTDTVALPYATSEAGYVDLRVTNAAGTVVRSRTVAIAAGTGTVTWEGGDYLGTAVPDGRYTARVQVRDLAGNRAAAVTFPVIVYGSLAGLTATPRQFFPQDADALAPSSKIAFTIRRAATVTLDIVDATGMVVYTRYTAKALAAGTYAFSWTGRNQAGAFVRAGWYTARVTASDGVGSATMSARVLADAFSITTSATATAPATRGRRLTVTAVTSEPLATTPALRVYEPGVTVWATTMTKVSATTWRVTVTLRTGGPAGMVTLRVAARDTGGRTNSTNIAIPLR